LERRPSSQGNYDYWYDEHNSPLNQSFNFAPPPTGHAVSGVDVPNSVNSTPGAGGPPLAQPLALSQ